MARRARAQHELGRPADRRHRQVGPLELAHEARGFGPHEVPARRARPLGRDPDGKISRYQAVVPTTWNASPRDAQGQPGPYEQALVGTPVADPARPLELLRTVHSFDPCLACAVHVLDAEHGGQRNDSQRGARLMAVAPYPPARRPAEPHDRPAARSTCSSGRCGSCHWTIVLALIVLSITGFYIYDPFLGGSGTGRPPRVHDGRDALHPRDGGVRVHRCGGVPDLLGVRRQPLRALARDASDHQGPAPRVCDDMVRFYAFLGRPPHGQRPQPARGPRLHRPVRVVHHHDPHRPRAVRMDHPQGTLDDAVQLDLERDVGARSQALCTSFSCSCTSGSPSTTSTPRRCSTSRSTTASCRASSPAPRPTCGGEPLEDEPRETNERTGDTVVIGARERRPVRRRPRGPRGPTAAGPPRLEDRVELMEGGTAGLLLLPHIGRRPTSDHRRRDRHRRRRRGRWCGCGRGMGRAFALHLTPHDVGLTRPARRGSAERGMASELVLHGAQPGWTAIGTELSEAGGRGARSARERGHGGPRSPGRRTACA